MKTIETKMPSRHSMSRWSRLRVLPFEIFSAAHAGLKPMALAQLVNGPYTFITLAGAAGYGTVDKIAYSDAFCRASNNAELIG